MNKIFNSILKSRIWMDSRGQDLIEYALIAGFVVVAAGAVIPDEVGSTSKIFSKVTSVMPTASTQS